jgi:UDP-N-acetylmuramate dehydrogenase
MLDITKNEICSLIKSKVLIDEPLKKHTTFGVGGIASLFIYPCDINDLKIILKYSYKNQIKLFFMGSGSNLLISDNGFDGIVICLRKSFKNFEFDNSFEAKIGTGVMLGQIVRTLIKKSVQGLESLIGVPGTLGGALIMNAGAYGSEISNYLVSIKSISLNGEEKTYSKQDLKFSYRYSSIPRDEIVVEAKFKFDTGDFKEIKIKKEKASQSRRTNQPLQYRSAGSIFKNPDSEKAAGYLIDKANLKGMKIGDAQISKKHANFIINHGNASSDNIIELIKIIKREVLKEFNIDLELEVELMGFNSPELDGIA